MTGGRMDATEAVLDGLSRGRPPRADAARGLQALLGVSVGRDGLSRFFQPGFPGLRSFVIKTRADPDQSVELTIVGVSRVGAPVWVARRVLLRGRDGSLEIHHLSDEVDPSHRARNVLVDCVRRELGLLDAVHARGPAPRITLEADGPARYLAALNGCEFADATDQGPSLRCQRPHDRSSDRLAMAAAARALLRRLAQKHALAEPAIQDATAAIEAARHPWEFARLELAGCPWPAAPRGEDGGAPGESLAGGLGRALLTAEDSPSWRAALYLQPRIEAGHQLGEAFRSRQTARAESRHAGEIGEARDALAAGNRALKLKALETLAVVGPAWVVPEVRALTESSDRRVATAARQALAAMNGTDLADRILAYADDATHDPARRGLAYRVLAEHFPPTLAPRVSMLRVNPDARLQRAVLPLLSDEPSEAGPDLASLLAANPWDEATQPRPGLLELRVELIERLAARPDARTLPALLAALASERPPSALEMAALTRALVLYPDQRARTALSQIAHRLERPAVP